MHVDRTCKAARLFRLSNPSGIARSRKACCNTRHEHQIARSPLWLSDIRRKNSRRGRTRSAKQAMREADRADAEAWPIRMAGTRAGPAQPSPTIAQCLNGGYGWLQVKCRRCETEASIPLEHVRRPRDTLIWKLEAALKC
jgi:hypothetical protein